MVIPRHDRFGRLTFEGRISYRGPLAIPSYPRVKSDLTQHEPVVAPTRSAPVLHSYPDHLPDQTLVTTYSLEELIAEKTRALLERTRPRDLYDVVFVLGNVGTAIGLSDLHHLFRSKCQAKGIPPPTASDVLTLVRGDQELLADWDMMLARQLPDLPPPGIFISRLGPMIQWIDAPPPEPTPSLASASARPGETPFAPASVQFTGTGSSLEAIRFAGANRLVVRFIYNGTQRTVEPYSLRRPATGNLLVYGWELEASQIKAFNLDKISSVVVTQEPYSPRYRVELSSIEPLQAPPPRRSTRVQPSGPSTRRRPRSSTGSRYIVQCPACGKRFYRDKYSTRLGKHKTKDGRGTCYSRSGLVVGTT